MDAFFASVEQLDSPELAHLPVAVGKPTERGVVAAASYQARAFGVRSAMSSLKARQLCPNLIFVPPRMERYHEVSQQIRTIFFDYTDLVEPLSLDEAYLDVTTNTKNETSATRIAQEIRQRIHRETQLTCSAGISYNKFLAKIASDFQKPNGQTTITPQQALTFLRQLPIEKFYGIGSVTASKMKQLGIFTGKDLQNQTLNFLIQNFGNQGINFYNIARGIHNSPVNPNRLIKSVSREITFEKSILSYESLLTELEKLSEKTTQRLRIKNIKGKTIMLKIKYDNFQSQTRSLSLSYFTDEASILFSICRKLLLKQPIHQPVRLLGIAVSQLNTAFSYGQQLQLEL